MAARLFLTGASGYVGGEALSQLSRLSPKHEIRCLVRDDKKGLEISKEFPGTTIVSGDLDNVELVEKEARNADVVFHLASTRHEPSSKAIAQGLSHQDRKAPGYWIQMSGASVFGTPEIKANKYGDVSDKVFDDVKDIGEILHIIQSNPARVVDNLVLAQDAGRVKTALIPGPLIYGKGSGPINKRSIQGPELAKYTLEKGHSFMVGKGESIWSNIHIHDLGKLFVSLFEAALRHQEGSWNQGGIFFPENGSMSFGDLARQISKAAHEQGLIDSVEVPSITSEEANQIMPHGAVLLGTNARLKSSSARQNLGWKPEQRSLADEIPDMVKEEAKSLAKL